MRLLLALTLAALAAATPALADGLPVLGVDVGKQGVADATTRYVTLDAGQNTVLASIRPNSGQVWQSRLLPGRLTIPAVAYDGSASGLSADGSTLVLIEPRLAFPRTTTLLKVLGTGRLSVRRTIRLDGDYSFDAISPRGRLIYLIHYLSVADPTRYEVRVYDLKSARLLPKPVTVPGEQMRGNPLSRATSRDGRFAYTLYDGNGATPFVHALDTSTVSARCLDLDALRGLDMSQFRLRLGAPGTLVVGNGLRPLLTIRLTGS
jgi:hypothetical protein